MAIRFRSFAAKRAAGALFTAAFVASVSVHPVNSVSVAPATASATATSTATAHVIHVGFRAPKMTHHYPGY